MSELPNPLQQGLVATHFDTIPVMLFRRGPVQMRLLGSLSADQRFELFVTDELTSEWRSFSTRVVGTIVATEDEPLSAFGYAVTAGITDAIVVMSERYASEEEVLIDAGAKACVTMPISAANLDRLYSQLRARAMSSSIDRTLRLLLDPITRTVWYRDRSVRLTQREFAMLHILSQNSGRAVSAENLLTLVWTQEPATTPERTRQVVDVYAYQLRKKLDQLGLKGVLVTLRGYGYALVQATGQR